MGVNFKDLKPIIKESVREVVREEVRDVLKNEMKTVIQEAVFSKGALSDIIAESVKGVVSADKGAERRSRNLQESTNRQRKQSAQNGAEDPTSKMVERWKRMKEMDSQNGAPANNNNNNANGDINLDLDGVGSAISETAQNTTQQDMQQMGGDAQIRQAEQQARQMQKQFNQNPQSMGVNPHQMQAQQQQQTQQQVPGGGDPRELKQRMGDKSLAKKIQQEAEPSEALKELQQG